VTFKKRKPAIGASPGTHVIPPGSQATRIRVFDYCAPSCTEREIADVEDLLPFVDTPTPTWVDLKGFGDERVLKRVVEMFGLHPLVLEDATHVPQRAKSQIDEHQHLIVARVPERAAGDAPLEVPQVFFVLGPHWLITFQDRDFHFFEPVRKRLRDGGGVIRTRGVDYLAYALIDALVDRYFPVLEGFFEQLDALEEEVHAHPGAELLAELHHVRRDLLIVRRIGWPQRDALRSLIYEESPFISADVVRYLHSTEQHITQVMEAIDSARETANSLVEIHLSTLSQRTNEIVKVLTLLSSIFIPLTFIAGVYGMNFDYMPELRARSGYPLTLAAMTAIAGGLLLYFRKRGWFRAARKRRR
jgi:magnesium transporter